MLHKARIGVCMDYKVAYLLEEKNHEKVITIIEAEDVQDGGLQQQEFLRKIYDIVKDFDKVSLFGPEKVKKELINRILAGRTTIEVQNNPIAEEVTENHKIDFINEYFSTCS